MANEITQRDWVNRLYRRVSRLRKLNELEAPTLILDGEKDLIVKAIEGLEPAMLVQALLAMEAGVKAADKERQDFEDSIDRVPENTH